MASENRYSRVGPVENTLVFCTLSGLWVAKTSIGSWLV